MENLKKGIIKLSVKNLTTEKQKLILFESIDKNKNLLIEHVDSDINYESFYDFCLQEAFCCNLLKISSQNTDQLKNQIGVYITDANGQVFQKDDMYNPQDYIFSSETDIQLPIELDFRTLYSGSDNHMYTTIEPLTEVNITLCMAYRGQLESLKKHFS